MSERQLVYRHLLRPGPNDKDQRIMYWCYMPLHEPFRDWSRVSYFYIPYPDEIGDTSFMEPFGYIIPLEDATLPGEVTHT